VIRSFDRLGSVMDEAAATAGSFLGHKHEVIRRSAERALKALAPHSGAAASNAAAMQLQHENPVARRSAAACLEALGALAAPHGAVLADLLEDTDVHVRRVAVRALVSAGPDVAPSLNEITERMGHANADTRRAAVDVMCGLGPICDIFSKSQGRVLIEEPSETPDVVMRMKTQALEILGMSGANAVPYLAHIAKEIESEDWLVRRTAVESMAGLGEHCAGNGAYEISKRMLHHDPVIRRAAVEAMGKLGKHAGTFSQRVEAQLDTEDNPDVKAACAFACEKLKAAGVLQASSPTGSRAASPEASPKPRSRGGRKAKD